MKETASDMAKRLMGEVQAGAKTHFTKGEVKSILNHFITSQFSLTNYEEGQLGCRGPTSVSSLRRGDVFVAKAVGGKIRPWIALHVDRAVVTAVAMSSGEHAPNMIKSQCRFWPGNWIGSTLSQFRLEQAIEEVTRPYTNRGHLREIEKTIAFNMGMKTYRPKKPKTLGQIARSVRAAE